MDPASVAVGSALASRRVTSPTRDRGDSVRTGSIGGVIILIWLIIGAIAAGQRGYYDGSEANCAKTGTIGLTVVAGPLNYVGANPKVECEVPEVPEPSQ
jgi:hypothetical protein